MYTSNAAPLVDDNKNFEKHFIKKKDLSTRGTFKKANRGMVVYEFPKISSKGLGINTNSITTLPQTAFECNNTRILL